MLLACATPVAVADVETDAAVVASVSEDISTVDEASDEAAEEAGTVTVCNVEYPLADSARFEEADLMLPKSHSATADLSPDAHSADTSEYSWTLWSAPSREKASTFM